MDKLSKLIIKNYDKLHGLVQEATPLLFPKEEEARKFFEEHNEKMTKKDILCGLHHMNLIMSSSIKNMELVANNLLRINQLLPRIKNGDYNVLSEIAAAFCTCKNLHITHVQYAMTFCALINPVQFPLFDNAVLSMMCANGRNLKKFIHNDTISNVGDCIRIAFFVKDFYDAIKDNIKDCSFNDIHSILTVIWKILTDSRVIGAIIEESLKFGLEALGLPPIISDILAYLIRIGVVEYLRPYLELYRKQKFK